MADKHSGESMGGNSPGRRKNANQNMWPGRPADAPEPKRAKPLPKGVQGQSLGGGKNRATKSQKDGCAVVALAMVGGATTLVIAAGYGLVEGIRAVIS